MKIVFQLPDDEWTEISYNWEYPSLPRIGDYIAMWQFIPETGPNYSEEFSTLVWNVCDIGWVKVDGEIMAMVGLENELSSAYKNTTTIKDLTYDSNRR